MGEGEGMYIRERLGEQRVRGINGNKENYSLFITNDVVYDHIVQRVFTSGLHLKSKNRNNIVDAISLLRPRRSACVFVRI